MWNSLTHSLTDSTPPLLLQHTKSVFLKISIYPSVFESLATAIDSESSEGDQLFIVLTDNAGSICYQQQYIYGKTKRLVIIIQ